MLMFGKGGFSNVKLEDLGYKNSFLAICSLVLLPYISSHRASTTFRSVRNHK